MHDHTNDKIDNSKMFMSAPEDIESSIASQFALQNAVTIQPQIRTTNDNNETSPFVPSAPDSDPENVSNVIITQPLTQPCNVNHVINEEEHKRRRYQEDCCCYLDPSYEPLDCFWLCRCILWICRSVAQCTERCCEDCAECINSCCQDDSNCCGGCADDVEVVCCKDCCECLGSCDCST